MIPRSMSRQPPFCVLSRTCFDTCEKRREECSLFGEMVQGRSLSCARLEEEEKLVSAEVLYRRASALDQTFQEAAEALEKLQLRIQVSEEAQVSL